MKHETRIRTLETKTKDQEKQLVSQGILLNNNGHGEDLDPDEVWVTQVVIFNLGHIRLGNIGYWVATEGFGQRKSRPRMVKYV